MNSCLLSSLQEREKEGEGRHGQSWHHLGAEHPLQGKTPSTGPPAQGNPIQQGSSAAWIKQAFPHFYKHHPLFLISEAGTPLIPGFSLVCSELNCHFHWLKGKQKKVGGIFLIRTAKQTHAVEKTQKPCWRCQGRDIKVGSLLLCAGGCSTDPSPSAPCSGEEGRTTALLQQEPAPVCQTQPGHGSLAKHSLLLRLLHSAYCPFS